MGINQTINSIKRRSESLCAILFYIAAGLCFFAYVGNFGGSFMPAMGTFLSMLIEVGLWLLVPVLISIRRRSVARWAFLGLSIFWVLTSIFSLLDGAGLAVEGAGGVPCSVGVFSFLIACALIVVTVLSTIAYWKKDAKLKIVSLLVYLGSLVFFLVLFALRVALAAEWNMNWSSYFGLVYSYIVIPLAMCFAAIAFWYTEKELYFAVFDKKTVKEEAPVKEEKTEKKAEKKPEVKAEDTAEKKAEKPAEKPTSETEPAAEEIAVAETEEKAEE